jgi:membrane peptidoglycan carboxypeptidase
MPPHRDRSAQQLAPIGWTGTGLDLGGIGAARRTLDGMNASRGRRAGSTLLHVALFLGVSVLAGVLVAGLALPVVGGAGLAARSTAGYYEDLPEDLQIETLPQVSRMLDADGREITRFYYQNRVTVPLSQVSGHMRRALVAIEDSRFYEHDGIDLRGTARAFVNNQSGDGVQGGSTITQQLVKNILVESAAARDDEDAARAAREKSYDRKLRELRYAIGLEKQLSKDEILERYLNISYFGSSAYGVQAAAQRYFSVDAKDLNVAQAALLAGIVRSPGAYDPIRNPEAAQSRRNVVVQRMATLGLITQARADRIMARGLGLKVSPVPNGCSRADAPYFCDFVVESLKNDEAFGATEEERVALLLRGGLTIKTTLDRSMQRAAQRAVDKNIPRRDRSGIATVSVSVKPGDGAIRAMAQNRTWGTQVRRGVTSINYAVEKEYGGGIGFQGGSTFKAFTAAAALQEGIPMGLRIDSPPQKDFTGFRNCETGAEFETYPVGNSTDPGTTSVDMSLGLAWSVNTWAVGLERRVGLCAPVEVAEALGVRRADGDPLQRIPAFTLGVDEVAPLRMAEAYATFAARGVHCSSYAVVEITDRDGKKVPHSQRECDRALDEPVADAMNSLLSDVIDFGTGRAMDFGRPAAGKTGTTTDNYDVWFVGHTPDLATAVWVGDPGRERDGRIVRRKMRGITINDRTINAAAGSTLAGPIWRETMSRALEDTPPTDFERPGSSVLFGEDVEVPDTRGMDEDEALRALDRAGLVGEVSEYPAWSGVVDLGEVVFSRPAAGATVPIGETVTISLNRGRSGGE